MTRKANRKLSILRLLIGRPTGIFSMTLLFGLLVQACMEYSAEPQARIGAPKVILIIGDGMDDQQITIARNYLLGAGGRYSSSMSLLCSRSSNASLATMVLVDCDSNGRAAIVNTNAPLLRACLASSGAAPLPARQLSPMPRRGLNYLLRTP